MDILEANHYQLTLPLNKVTNFDDLYRYFDKELLLQHQITADKDCFLTFLKNLNQCDKIRENNIQEFTLNLTGWKSLSRKNERLFDYFLDALKKAEAERMDNIKFNYKLIEEW